ncbi:hypothetical protein SF12_15530 [Streptomyces sp. MBRL 601]|nr:hypothetical protein SF12_15530 [Streptomyces sp. MBRL 601]
MLVVGEPDGHLVAGDAQGDVVTGVFLQGAQQRLLRDRRAGGDLAEGREQLPAIGELLGQCPAVTVLPSGQAQPDPVRHRLDADQRGAPDLGGGGSQVVAVDRAGPALLRRARGGQGPGGEPVAVGRREGDRLAARLDVEAAEHRHPRLVRGRRQHLLDRVRQYGALHRGDQRAGRVAAERGPDDRGLLPCRRGVLLDPGEMRVEQPCGLLGPGVEDRLDPGERHGDLPEPAQGQGSRHLGGVVVAVAGDGVHLGRGQQAGVGVEPQGAGGQAGAAGEDADRHQVGCGHARHHWASTNLKVNIDAGRRRGRQLPPGGAAHTPNAPGTVRRRLNPDLPDTFWGSVTFFNKIRR